MSSRGFTDPNQRLAPYVDPHIHPVGNHDHVGIPSASNLVWDDLRVEMGRATVGTDPPTLATFLGTTQALSFSAAATNSVMFVVQLPHGWAQGTTVHPHIHWAPATTNVGNVRWELEYTWANMTGTFGAPTVLTVDAAAGGVAFAHKVTAFGSIVGTGKTDSSVIVCRAARLGAHGNDTFTGAAFGLSIDFHIQLDSIGDSTQP